MNTHYPTRKKILSVAAAGFLLAAGLFIASCGAQKDESFSVGVFVPGYVEGSPTYELMAAGAEEAASRRDDIEVTIVEAGPNQTEWEEALSTMAASNRYDLIISSNPALPEIAAAVAERVPEQRFLLLDADGRGHSSIAAVEYNHFEQAFLNGAFAAMISLSDLDHAKAGVRLGLVAGQEYPVMNNVIRRGFLEGARSVSPGAELDFRVVGGWNDPTKAGELARSIIAAGSDVILTIAGGGNQGVVTSAMEHGAYVTWFDAPGYDYAPGTVLGSTEVRQDLAAREQVLAAADDELEYGSTKSFGIREGYIGFVADHPVFVDTVPAPIRDAIIDLEQAILNQDITVAP